MTVGTVVTLEQLKEVEDILKEIGVPHFLVGSMVLVVYRDHEFLPGNQDLDIGILNENSYYHETIRDKLLENGWTVWQERDSTGPRLDMEKKVGEERWSLNIHYFKKYDNYRWSSIFQECQMYDADIFNSIKWADFKGFQVPILEKTEEYLEAEYGDWQIPKTIDLTIPMEKSYCSIQKAKDFGLWEKVKETVEMKELVGYAFVVGDLFHIGHLRFLQKCKEHCDFLIVGVYNDELTTSYKREPVIPFKERIAIFRALKCVDLAVRIEPKDTPNGLDVTPILRKLVARGYNIKRLFHGDDWKDVDGRKYLEKLGGNLILIPYYQGQSTTAIMKRIKNLETLEKKHSEEKK